MAAANCLQPSLAAVESRAVLAATELHVLQASQMSICSDYAVKDCGGARR